LEQPLVAVTEGDKVSNVTPFKEERGDVTLVGARYNSSGTLGPVAQVYADKDWVWIVTDSYEGSVMLNIEALPLLIEALRKLAPSQQEGNQG
jgi:hypothetical protein